MSCSATHWGGRDARFIRGWRPIELVAMIGGFVLFWPVGLAVLAWKGWKDGWWVARDRMAGASAMAWPWSYPRQEWSAGRGDRNFAWSHELNRDSGNWAFEQYKSEELGRLQEEFERLAKEQQAFAEHIEALRRAKDKAEFESFLAARRSATPSGGPGPQGQGGGESSSR